MIELADGAVWVGSYDLNGNQSKLTLGSSNSLTKTKGHLSELSVGINPSTPNQGGAGGIVVIKNGQFAIWNLANNRSVKIAANAALRVNNLEGAGTIDNQGQFLVKDYEGKAAAFELNCAFSNSGASSLLDASAVENSPVNNYLLNEGKTIFKNLAVTRSLINAGTFTVAGSGRHG